MNKNAVAAKPYLPIKEAADFTGLSQYELRRMVHSQECPHIKCGTKVLINVSGLLKHLEHLSYGNAQAGAKHE